MRLARGPESCRRARLPRPEWVKGRTARIRQRRGSSTSGQGGGRGPTCLGRCGNDRTNRWTPSILWCSSTRHGSRSATRAWYGNKAVYLAWRSPQKADKGCWGCGGGGGRVQGLSPTPSARCFPHTAVQTCIVHLIRKLVGRPSSWKDRKKVMPDLKAVYRAESAEGAAARLDEFEACWGQRYPGGGPPLGGRAWEHVVPMFAFPPVHPQDDLYGPTPWFLAIRNVRSARGALLTGSLRCGNLQSCSRIAFPATTP